MKKLHQDSINPYYRLRQAPASLADEYRNDKYKTTRCWYRWFRSVLHYNVNTKHAGRAEVQHNRTHRLQENSRLVFRYTSIVSTTPQLRQRDQMTTQKRKRKDWHTHTHTRYKCDLWKRAFLLSEQQDQAHLNFNWICGHQPSSWRAFPFKTQWLLYVPP
jgi:hypothetical protein